MRVAYLGPAGTFSEEAAVRYYREGNLEGVPCGSIPEVLDAVQTGAAEQGVIPIENSIEGSVNVALDGLMDRDTLFICGELVLPVEQHLLALPGVELTDIREAWSIAPALAQCRQFLQQQGLRTELFPSTAAAARAVAESGRTDAAAVGSAWAARKFGLQIVRKDIHDAAVNYTRFVVIRRDELVPDNASKTTLVVLPAAEHAGVLAHILNVFAAFDLNLSWIVSRPTKTTLGLYLFALDVEAGLHTEALAKTLDILRIYGHQVRVLGSFPASKL